MLTKNYSLENFHINYPIHAVGDLSRIVFIDIETTGLSPINNSIYMIGLCFYKDETWCITQLFAQSPCEEVTILESFHSVIQDYDTIIHFNGNRFDLPFIQQRAKQYNLSFDFSSMHGIDLYKRSYALRNLIVLPNYTQKTIEQFLQINRKDICSGQDLIKAYATYQTAPRQDLLALILQHNYDDLLGLLQILPILTYSDLLSDTTKIKKVQMQTTSDCDDNIAHELLLTLHASVPVPKAITCNKYDCYMKVSEHIITIKVPVYQQELKYFYKNYKDYYYIKELDNAFHKSVSNFADRTIREQATAATCYTRKTSTYLRQFEQLVSPVYKKDYKDSDSFFEITQDIRTDRELFQNYALHIIRMML